MNNEQKTYIDWVYGKAQGVLEALKCQGIITQETYDLLGDLIHQTDRYREELERTITKDKK